MPTQQSASDSLPDGVSDGPADGVSDGPADGVSDGPADGVSDGPADGVSDGPADGVSDGPAAAASETEPEASPNTESNAPINTPSTSSLVTFGDLATATYCPRKLYYTRRDEDRTPPARAARARRLADQYPDLLVASDTALRTFDLAVPPDRFRTNLERAKHRFDRWPDIIAPAERNVIVSGKDCRGRVHKVIDGTGRTPPIPTLVSPGRPPDQGVWAPQGVRAVAAAKALSWREQEPIECAFVEYPFHGVIRRVAMTTRRAAAYRRTLRTVRALADPPPRIHDDARCGACEYRGSCGVQTQSLRSLL